MKDSLNQNMSLTFSKTDGRWYVDLPTWEGSKDELEMVCGADLLLDIIDMNQEHSGLVHIEITNNKNKYSRHFELKMIKDDCQEGRNYSVNNGYTTFDIWLCSVTTFVFGDYPETIYFNF